jgi:hypothetical protein
MTCCLLRALSEKDLIAAVCKDEEKKGEASW